MLRSAVCVTQQAAVRCKRHTAILAVAHAFAAASRPQLQYLTVPPDRNPVHCVLTAASACCRISDTEPHYYADGEDAYDMKKELKPKSPLADSMPSSKASKAGQKQQQGKADTPKASPSKAAGAAAPEEAKEGQEEASPKAKPEKESSNGGSGSRPSSGTPKKGKGHKGKS